MRQSIDQLYPGKKPLMVEERQSLLQNRQRVEALCHFFARLSVIEQFANQTINPLYLNRCMFSNLPLATDGQFHFQQRQITDHRCQGIAHLMGHASGKMSDGRHFFRAQQFTASLSQLFVGSLQRANMIFAMLAAFPQSRHHDIKGAGQ